VKRQALRAKGKEQSEESLFKWTRKLWVGRRPGFYFLPLQQALILLYRCKMMPTSTTGSRRERNRNDTSGYAADVRAKYEGFFLTDSSVSINGSDLAREHTDLVLVMTGRCRLWTAAQIKFSRSQRQRIMN